MASDLEIKAKEAYIDDHFELAAELFSQAIEQIPESAELLAERAQAYIKLNYFTGFLAFLSYPFWVFLFLFSFGYWKKLWVFIDLTVSLFILFLFLVWLLRKRKENKIEDVGGK